MTRDLDEAAKYLVGPMESMDYQAGKGYFEVRRGVVTRQVEVYGEMRFWALPDAESDPDHPIADDILEESVDDDIYAITQEEFECEWNAARGGGVV